MPASLYEDRERGEKPLCLGGGLRRAFEDGCCGAVLGGGLGGQTGLRTKSSQGHDNAEEDDAEDEDDESAPLDHLAQLPDFTVVALDADDCARFSFPVEAEVGLCWRRMLGAEEATASELGLDAVHLGVAPLQYDLLFLLLVLLSGVVAQGSSSSITFARGARFDLASGWLVALLGRQRHD